MTDDQSARYTVTVQQLVEGMPNDDYTIDDGWKPVLEVEDNGDLWISKVMMDDDGARSTVVAVYARGMWAKVHIEEAD
jgi:hypothetical protein